jgi:hypothetical protein
LLGIDVNVPKARQVCAEVRAEEAALKQLAFACEQRSEHAVKLAIARCEALKLAQNEAVAQAKELRKQLEKENSATKAVAQASVKGDAGGLRSAVDKAARWAGLHALAAWSRR